MLAADDGSEGICQHREPRQGTDGLAQGGGASSIHTCRGFFRPHELSATPSQRGATWERR